MTGLALAVLAIAVLGYAFIQLQDQTRRALSGDGPLQVRTDLMRGRLCHVSNGMIMGDCTAEEILELQQKATQ